MPSKTFTDTFPIVVIGAGAAGMIAAWRAASMKQRTILLEKNSRVGIKILISGGGRCNITHAGEMETIRQQFRTNEGRFLKHSFFQFSNALLLRQLNQRGVETYMREDGRIFPRSGKAGDVVHAMRRMMEEAGAEIRLSTAVEKIVREDAGLWGVQTSHETITTRRVIIATGGASYPRTGTTGDGFLWARELGHTIVPIRPALAPILLASVPPTDWHGTAIRDCELFATTKSTVVARHRGDLLFTHEGVSGPAALEISRDAYLSLEKSLPVELLVDFVPEESAANLENRIKKEIAENGARQVQTLVELLVPKRLAPFVVSAAEVEGTKKCHQIKREERKRLVSTLKQWEFGRVRDIPLERGEVTAGGVDLREIDPKTMQSRIVSGLYICGEALDIAGPVGGYNLQAAFSTGYVAGESAAKDSMNSVPLN